MTARINLNGNTLTIFTEHNYLMFVIMFRAHVSVRIFTIILG